MEKSDHPSARPRVTDRNVAEFISELMGNKADFYLQLDDKVIERSAGALLAGALLSERTDEPLWAATVSEARWEQFPEVVFGLANRTGRVSFSPSIPDSKLAAWRTRWTPGTRQQWLTGLAASSSSEPSIFGRDHAAFVDPHLSGTSSNRSGVGDIVSPWLRQTLPRAALGSEFVVRFGRLVDELVDNVAEHAALEPKAYRELKSLVVVSVARGAKKEARYRVHASVLDTGIGILASLRKKYPALPEREHFFAEIFEGRLSASRHGRGFGLPAIWREVCAVPGARLVAYSNERLVRGVSGELKPSTAPEHIRGCIVTLTFPIGT